MSPVLVSFLFWVVNPSGFCKNLFFYHFVSKGVMFRNYT